MSDDTLPSPWLELQQATDTITALRAQLAEAEARAKHRAEVIKEMEQEVCDAYDRADTNAARVQRLVDGAEKREEALKAKLQHRAKQVIQMDKQMRDLSLTLSVLKKVIPEVPRFLEGIGDLAKMIVDHKAAYRDGEGGGEDE